MTLVVKLYFLLFMHGLLTLVSSDDETDSTCAKSGGFCLSTDTHTCLDEIDVEGCDKDEVCCKREYVPLILDDIGLRIKCDTTKKCRIMGGVCYDPRTEDRQCDVSNKKLCTHKQCTCCITCEKQKPPKACIAYGGKCQKTCDSDRIVTGACQTGCKCCGCKISSECSDINGHCIKKGENCDGRVSNIGCDGTNCRCCVPDPPTTISPEPEICKNTSSCVRAGGFCDFQCPPDARMNSSLCEGNCTCCLPPEPEPEGCNTTAECEGVGGYCNHTCLPEEEWKYGMCDRNCACCIPPEPEPCKNTSMCLGANGYCNYTCAADEPSDTSLCEGNCTCCLPPEPEPEGCNTTAECRGLGGYCNYTCLPEEEWINGMCDRNCGCCIPPKPEPCKNTSMCLRAKGYCNYTCAADELSDPSLCEGNCTCCLPPEQEPQGCNTTAECQGFEGYCNYTCLPEEEWIYGICDRNCACCIPPKVPEPCNQTDCCSKLNGRCDSTCFPGMETTIPGLCANENCSCCIPGVFCDQSQSCYDHLGTCQSHCSPNYLSFPELCDGSTCTCCAPPRPTNQIECWMISGVCYNENLGQICSTVSYGMCEDGSRCCLLATAKDGSVSEE